MSDLVDLLAALRRCGLPHIEDSTRADRVLKVLEKSLVVIAAAEACRDSPDNLYDEADAFRVVCDAVDAMRSAARGATKAAA